MRSPALARPATWWPGNSIGTDVTGTLSIANAGTGVELDSPAPNTIGGTTAAARNIISANAGSGVSITNLSNDNLVQGNYIGTDKSGTQAWATTRTAYRSVMPRRTT